MTIFFLSNHNNHITHYFQSQLSSGFLKNLEQLKKSINQFSQFLVPPPQFIWTLFSCQITLNHITRFFVFEESIFFIQNLFSYFSRQITAIRMLFLDIARVFSRIFWPNQHFVIKLPPQFWIFWRFFLSSHMTCLCYLFQ